MHNKLNASDSHGALLSFFPLLIKEGLENDILPSYTENGIVN
jgi:hypothetical protein